MADDAHWLGRATRSRAPAKMAMKLPLAGMVLLLRLGQRANAQQRFLNTAAFTKYAAVGLPAGALPSGIAHAIGEGDAPSTPLMVQDQIWEPRCDNAYPNVIHSPGDPNGDWRLWYGCMTSGTKFSTSQGSDRTTAWLYANSSDGLKWEKPPLGVYDLSTGPEAHNKALPAATIAALKAAGKNNNIVLGSSDGMGITLDEHETNLTRKFKVFGGAEFPPGPGGSGISSSPDGIHFAYGDFRALKFSKKPVCNPGEPACPAGNQRYDDHQQPLWDEPTRQYVMTTRTYPGMRAIGLFRTPSWPPTGDEQITQVVSTVPLSLPLMRV